MAPRTAEAKAAPAGAKDPDYPMIDNPEKLAKAALPACPICGRHATPEFKPFCTARCADVDLNRWLGGVYRVEVNDPEAEIETDFDPSPERLH